MLKKSERLNPKKDPQQFLQYKSTSTENHFEMILINNPHPPSVTIEPHLPSGFKPLYSSTPKRSRKSFVNIEKSLPKITPTPHLRMSQFIGVKKPHPLEQNQSTGPLNQENNNFVAAASNISKTSTISNDITAVHFKPRRSTSCESWESFQKHLGKIFNTKVKDLNIAKDILKLIFQFNSHSKNNKRGKSYNDENLKIFGNYVKTKALLKAIKNVDDWIISKTILSESIKSHTENVGSFKGPFPGRPFKQSKPQQTKADNGTNEFTFEKMFNTNDKPMSFSRIAGSFKHPVVLPTLTLNEDQIATTTIRDNHKYSTLCFNSSELNSSLQNNKHDKQQQNEVWNTFEQFPNLNISTKTIEDFSFSKKLFLDSIGSGQVFDKDEQSRSSSKNFAPFKAKPINSYFKTKRVQSQSPYFDFNQGVVHNQIKSRHYHSKPKNYSFEEDFQKFFKTTIRGGDSEQQNMVTKSPIFTKSKNDSRDLQLSPLNSNSTEDILKSIKQWNSSSRNYPHQNYHPNRLFENFCETNFSTTNTTIDSLSILNEIFPDFIEI